jgi:hypothetical protein
MQKKKKKIDEYVLNYSLERNVKALSTIGWLRND